jgi:hypothetical protein
MGILEPTTSRWAEILHHYDGIHRHRAEDELHWFIQARSLAEVISRAALAIDSRGKRFAHQRRIPSSALREARAALLREQSKIQACRDFDELLTTITHTLDDVFGLCELFCYDTAFRIGGYLRLYPEKVYLHSGTREGARALGLRVGLRKAIDVAELPDELGGLPPHEIEDILCIYKADFLHPPKPVHTVSGCCAPNRHEARRRC